LVKNESVHKEEEEEEVEEKEMTMIEKLKALAEEEKKCQNKRRKVDSMFPMNGEIVDDFDCMLNQTNIGANNNKFYVIQLLKIDQKTYYVWNRWGRVVSLSIA